jgi:hypothetical protein
VNFIHHRGTLAFPISADLDVDVDVELTELLEGGLCSRLRAWLTDAPAREKEGIPGGVADDTIRDADKRGGFS